MEINTYNFSSLNTDQLYGLLQLRSEVFVVEQDCVYQDIDGKDQKALHVLGTVEGNIVAYTRIFKPGDYLEKAAIGRVVVASDFRKRDFGKAIMQASIAAVEKHFNTTAIGLSAQTYLLNFYNDLGFSALGETYLEDGIPHIYMERSPLS
ncbi:GCN5-related N-acetyltransferase [Flavobacteria bacterium MS024-3C]|nr:GCN5-related N-acetyltransferase [Flavobacteria bacterium MS024-3C]MDA9273406.1 GNAT family N-acetyltransferase [Flavobacteriaceae bacterium]MDB9730806.1 GNAT family N-acetyltransferase [Flavobacteriaceae bacterium]